VSNQKDDLERLKSLALTNPREFRRLISMADKKVMRPHEGQKAVLESDARFKVMNCGRRFGKTKLAAYIITKKAREENQMLWWIAPTYKVVKRGYAEVLRQLPDGVLTHDPPPDTNFDAGRSVILKFKNGSRMEFYSAERPEGMLGEGVDFAVFDEAAIMPGRIWNQIVRPTLMDRLGGALFISTPRGRNWFYKAWQQGQDNEQPNWASWTFPSSSNPYLPEGEVEEMQKQLPRLEYEQEVEAKFLAAGSSVFVVPDRSVQKGRILPNYFIEGVDVRGHSVVLGIDLARTNDWTVIYGARANDRRNCYYERMQAITWPEQKRRIRRAVRQIEKAGADTVMMILDSTGVGDPIVEDLEAEGYDVVGINFTTHKINMVRLLSKDLEETQAFVLESRLNEFEDYQMALTPAGRMTYSAPEGENDDVVAAKMLQHWGLVTEGVPEVMVLTADGPVEVRGQTDDPEAAGDEDYTDLVEEEPDDDWVHSRQMVVQTPSLDDLMHNPNAWF
jgi:hypothetical protein